MPGPGTGAGAGGDPGKACHGGSSLRPRPPSGPATSRGGQGGCLGRAKPCLVETMALITPFPPNSPAFQCSLSGLHGPSSVAQQELSWAQGQEGQAQSRPEDSGAEARKSNRTTSERKGTRSRLSPSHREGLSHRPGIRGSGALAPGSGRGSSWGLQSNRASLPRPGNVSPRLASDAAAFPWHLRMRRLRRHRLCSPERKLARMPAGRPGYRD